MPKSKQHHEFPVVPIDKKIVAIIEKCVNEQTGQLPDFESAIGALIIGQSFGWRVLYLIHTHGTLNKYCEILQIKNFKEHCPEVGVYAMRCDGFRWIQNAKDF